MINRSRNNIQQILFYSIFAVLLILCLVFVLALFIKNKQSEVFKESSKAQLSRSIELYANVKESVLKSTLLDYTFWDEMVNFVRKPDEKWAELNLSSNLNTFKFEALWVFDTAKHMVYSLHNEHYPQLAGIPETKGIFNELYQKRYIHTFHYSDTVLIELLGSTIHPSDDPYRKTDPKGYLFYARVWNSSFIKEFSEITSTDIKVFKTLPVGNQEIESEIHISKPLISFENNNLAYLSIQKKLSSFWLFNRLSQIFVIILLLASVLIIFILFFTSRRYISKPLTIIEESLKNNNKEKTKELNNYTSEFSEIGALIRNFIEQKSLLEIAKAKAEESEKLKSAFLANMSHEIRSPLNGIIGFSELLTELETDEKVQRFASYISSRSKDLLRIINDILDFSRIEAQQLEVIKQNFFLHPLFDELEQQYNNTEKTEKGTRVVFLKGSNIELNTDSLRLKQIFINLIDNAIKFTQDGTVEVGYIMKNSSIEFYVKDNGIGIAKEKIAIIFDRFRQINETPNSRQGGNGLGLALCKGLIELMDGKIWVTSEENMGSTFNFYIPYKKNITETNHT